MRRNRWVLWVAGLLLLAGMLLPLTVAAQDPDYDQVNEIAKELNCPTCAGLNLADCRTQTCAQWREQIQDLVDEGYSKQEVLDYFVNRYGTQVLQEPPRSGFTLVLWVLPVIALVAGGGWLFYILRRWSKDEDDETVETTWEAGSDESQPVSRTSIKPDDDYLSQVEKDLGLS